MERLQKVIATAGITSRGKAEVLINEGRVVMNGETITKLGYKVKRRDLVEVDDRVTEKKDKVYFLMDEPRHTMYTSDDEFGRQTVMDLVDCRQYILTVRRLGYDADGVTILINDEGLVNETIHPQCYTPKVYNLTISNILTPEDMRKVKTGIVLDDGARTLLAKYRMTERGIGKNQCSSGLIIVEGRNRQIKRTMEVLGYRVRRLYRSRLAFLHCNDLRRREYRVLKPFEVEQLRSLA